MTPTAATLLRMVHGASHPVMSPQVIRLFHNINSYITNKCKLPARNFLLIVNTFSINILQELIFVRLARRLQAVQHTQQNGGPLRSSAFPCRGGQHARCPPPTPAENAAA